MDEFERLVVDRDQAFRQLGIDIDVRFIAYFCATVLMCDVSRNCRLHDTRCDC
jgi:hypothetical protein